jgi:ABC-type nitrate/sulfonate/bicarbonate transport system substrate-binding protein
VSPRAVPRLIVLGVAGLVLVATLASAQAPEETTLAVPALSLTFSSTFLVEELGLWEKEGLRVKISTVTGVGSANAVLAGSVDFAPMSSPTLVRADARGQRLFAIAQLLDRMPLEAVLRKDVGRQGGNRARHADRQARPGPARQAHGRRQRQQHQPPRAEVPGARAGSIPRRI